MTNQKEKSVTTTYGSSSLDQIVKKLQSTNDSKKKYEYLLWLAKKLPILPKEFHCEELKVKGCVSQVYLLANLHEKKLHWRGFSDALITKGMISLLIIGFNELSPEEIIKINPAFIEDTGLVNTLTPSRANGFMNIFLKMKMQAKSFL